MGCKSALYLLLLRFHTSSASEETTPLFLGSLEDVIEQLQETSASERTTTVIHSLPKDGKLNLHMPPKKIGGVNDDTITFKNGKGIKDAGFRCHAYDIRNIQEDVHVTSFAPHITPGTGGDNELSVHHMDIFMCEPGIETDFPSNVYTRNNWCGSYSFMLGRKPTCKQMVWAHDKGASSFELPDNVGLRLGPSTGFSHLLVQVHYLMPEDFEFSEDNSIIESSGFNLTLSEPREFDCHAFAFGDVNVYIEPHQKSYAFTANLTSQDIAAMIGPDLMHFGEVHPIAAQLHAHNLAKSVKLTHLRDGEVIGDYALIDPYHGYGPDQTFVSIPEGSPPLLPGDSISITCIYDTSDIDVATTNGVGHGNEMCNPMILYYPHVKDISTVNLKIWDSSFYSSRHDASAEEVHTLLKKKFAKFKKLEGPES